MKFCALGMDENARSTMTDVEVPLTRVSDTEWLSEKQDAKTWSLAMRQPGEPLDGGPSEMHLTNFPSLVCSMQGHLQVTGQDGATCRLAPGAGIFLDGRALHHSKFGPSRVPVLYLTMTFQGTEGHAFK